MRLPLFLVLSLLSLSESALAQWQIVAPTLIGNKANLTAGGSLIYSDGVLWAGYSQLFRSSDNGETWQTILPFFQQGNWITDINFFDRDNGLVSTFDDGVYRTTDGGATWKHILTLQYILGSCFGSSASDIISLESAPATSYVSHDGGVSWKPTVLNSLGRLVRRSAEGKIFAITADQNNSGSFFTSIDNGETWKQAGGRFDGDSYSFGFDFCEHRLFVVNEDVLNRTDDFAQIFSSTDDGESFTIALQEDIEYFTGSIAISANAAYCQTFKKGILRTTDHGATWESIGGPNGILDAAFLTAINDDIILALDPEGQLWRTTNGGGKPILRPAPLTLSRDSLFSVDTVTECLPRFDTLLLTSQLCNDKPLPLDNVYIEGPGAASYALVEVPKLVRRTGDNVVVLFTPKLAGIQAANLIIHSAEGGYDTLALSGYGIPLTNYALSTEDRFTKVIGDSLSIPVKCDYPAKGTIDLRIEFDPNYLVYKSAYDKNGVQLTDTYISEGAREIRINGGNGQSAEKTIADLQFLFFPTDAIPTRIKMTMLTRRGSVCGEFTDAVSTITTPPGCELPILSGFLRYKTFPTVTLRPNPAKNLVTISSVTNLGDCTVTIYNMVGEAMLVRQSSIAASVDINVATLPEGAYSVEIISGVVRLSRPLVITR